MTRTASRRCRFLIPEVVQTSAMDCGPASLKCLLEGFGISVSYGRLREACQTDVDGTSIDTLEAVACHLGLHAEQVMLPVDHVLLPDVQALPALAIVRLPHGDTHVVVLWRRHGGWVQVMDPATGRRWVRVSQMLDELYVHSLPIAAEMWLAWAASESFLAPLRHRLAKVGVAAQTVERLMHDALASAQWLPLASLDAAVRMVHALVGCGALRAGRQTQGALLAFLGRARNVADVTTCIPDPYWSVRPAPVGPEGEAQVMLRGAVLIHVTGPSSTSHPVSDVDDTETQASELAPELAAALNEAPSRPARTLWQMIRQDGLLSPTLLTLALALGGGGVLVEAVLFRGFIDLSRDLSLSGQRLGAMGLILTLVILLLMGRNWPPTAQDLREAETLCRELGLGELLDRMPGGLLQMVGETGWQLSHGEQSRLFMARALLQRADMVILDESFAALDPANLDRALHCVSERAETFLVIAHP